MYNKGQIHKPSSWHISSTRRGIAKYTTPSQLNYIIPKKDIPLLIETIQVLPTKSNQTSCFKLPKQSKIQSKQATMTADWRCDKSGNVKGYLRRKGDPNPLNWAYKVDDSIKNHPNIDMIKIDVPKADDTCKSCEKRERAKLKKEENKNSAGGCVVM